MEQLGQNTCESGTTVDDDCYLIKACQVELPYNTTSFEQLVKRHEATVFYSCLRQLKQRENAEDASQAVFLKVFQRIHAFSHRSSFRTWLYRIVRNECIDRMRQMKKQAERLDTFQQESELEFATVLSDINGFGDGLVADSLSKLREDDQLVLTLRFVADLSLTEMAEVLQIGRSATKMRLYRAQERFQKKHRNKKPPLV